ncbi:hypothetical protein ACC696_37530, partial [Rhizobium ruizarguesonis]
STFGLAPMVGVYCLLEAGGSGLNLANSPLLALLVIFAVGAIIGAFNCGHELFLVHAAFLDDFLAANPDLY